LNRHQGVVLSNQNHHYLVGFNQRADRHASFLLIDSNTIPGTKIYGGLAITNGGSSPIACRICLLPAEQLSSWYSVRKAVASLGILQSSDLMTPTMVSRVLNQESELGPNQLSLPELESIFFTKIPA
jgi:hypothetical protein